MKTAGGPQSEERRDPVMEAISVAAPHVNLSLPCSWDPTPEYEGDFSSSTDTAKRNEHMVSPSNKEQDKVDSPRKMSQKSTGPSKSHNCSEIIKKLKTSILQKILDDCLLWKLIYV